jgi:hypothetical protein
MEKRNQFLAPNYTKMNGTLHSTPQSNLTYKTPNQSREQILDEPKSHSTPNNQDKEKIKSPPISPIPLNIRAIKNEAQIDPYTFAKLYEIQKKTDEVLLSKMNGEQAQIPVKNQIMAGNQRNSEQIQNNHRIYDVPPQSQKSPAQISVNENFVRNSPQRSTISDLYTNRLQKVPTRETPTYQEELPGYVNYRMNLRQPERSQSVLDGMTCAKYSDVQLRHQNGNGSVTMRRPESGTLDKKQIMQKIYEYYRKSVNNTPVPFQDNNLRTKSQSTDTSPVSYASVNTTSTATLPKVPPHGVPNDAIYTTVSKRGARPQYSQNRLSYTNSDKTDASSNRQKTISESDSVFLPEETQPRQPVRYFVLDSHQITPGDVIRLQSQSLKLVPVQMAQQQVPKQGGDPNRIYDSVYGANVAQYGQIKPPRAYPPANQQTPQNQVKMIQRPASAMGYLYQQPLYLRQQPPTSNGRSTPLILQQVPVMIHQTSQKDLYSNPNIYRPIAAQRHPAVAMGQQRPKQQQMNARSPIKNEYSNYDYPRRFEKIPVAHYESESGSEAGEVQRIMNKENGEFFLKKNCMMIFENY